MKTLFWKAFYKVKFGKDYQERMKNVARLGATIAQSTVGNLSSFYDANGNQIRGFHRRTARHTTPPQHPLLTKYGR